MMEWSEIKISDGTDQENRLAAALRPGYINVDELSFEALLALATEFASKVNFYNLRNELDGDWAALFTADEAVIMAMIMSADLKRLEAEFLRRHTATLEILADYVLQRIETINFWFSKLSRVEHWAGDSLREKIAVVIEEKLVTELHNFGVIVTQLPTSGEPHRIDYAAFGPLWRLDKREDGYHFPHARIATPATHLQARQQLRVIFYALFNVISYLKTITPFYLQQSLGSQAHDPATGLFMAFLKLYERAQQRLNRFTERHLDFYYQQLLKATARGPLPESLYLCVAPEVVGEQRVLIRQGSEFSAGKDSALQEIIYRADDDLWVSDARVTSLCTLYLQRDALLSPEYELEYVSRIKANRLTLPSATTEASEWVAWPLFGADRAGATHSAAEEARLGFVIASPLLLLKEGRRKVELNVTFEELINADVALMVGLLTKTSQEAEFIKLFGRLFSRYLLNSAAGLERHHKAVIITKAESTLDAISAEEVKKLLSEERLDLFYTLFSQIFSIKLTTGNGWLAVEDYLMLPLSGSEYEGKLGFRLAFSLGPEVEAITPCRAEIHGDGFEDAHPLLHCSINPRANVYPYSLFHDLVVKSVVIDAEVSGVKSLKLYNQNGQLDPSKPFLPFGPLPSSNSYLIFGCYEIAKKNLVELNLQLEWAELPTAEGGFADHYLGYGGRVNNDSFKADFAVLVDGDWKPRDSRERQRQTLFESERGRGRVAASIRLPVPLARYTKIGESALAEEAFDYNFATRAGFFRLALVEPASAFGQREYATLLTAVLSANVKLKKAKSLPNPPYTPTLNHISLHYRARSTLCVAGERAKQGAEEGRLYHLHPFGIEPIGVSTHAKPSFLLPQYGYEGNLFIGLSAQQLQGPLTLFFHLATDLAQEVATRAEPLTWFYLASDSWKVIERARVLADTTDGFLTSGIVTIDLPAEINRDNTSMPADCFWLRVAARRELRSFCSLYAVQTHALRVTRRSPADTEAVEVSPLTRWRPLRSIPGVGKVTQVGRPFGGAAAEQRPQFITRMSERLRHKNRASTPWDYERLILQQFPQLFKVKCLANMSSTHGYPSPGHLLIVVIPALPPGERRGCPTAMMNVVELGRIRAFVQSIAIPFVEIEVRNPLYEQVQVRCSVKFNHPTRGGHYINLLDRALSDYLCPWESVGHKARFGWSVRQKDVESYIRSLEYVDFVTNFSMLHIAESTREFYQFFDTAHATTGQETVLRPRYPWGLAIPAKHHFIEAVETNQPIKAEVTGLDELEVGGTFIIGGNGF